MVFNSTVFIIGSIVVMVVWLSVLTVLVMRAISHYNRLSTGVTKAGLSEALDTILRTLHMVRTKSDATERMAKTLGAEANLHIQRIGIVRFNPFADTGGAQSFAIALLNKQNSGIVMTSLYGRSGNRWYIKEIVAAKGKDLALSKEEEGAIANAMRMEGTHHE